MFRIQFWKGFMKVGLRASNMYKSSFLFWKFYAFQHHFWLVTLLRQFCNAHLAAHHRQTQTDQVVARDLDSRSRNDVKFDKLYINQAKPTHSPSFWKLTKVWCISRLAWISATKTRRPTDWLQRLFSPRIRVSECHFQTHLHRSECTGGGPTNLSRLDAIRHLFCTFRENSLGRRLGNASLSQHNGVIRNLMVCEMYLSWRTTVALDGL